MIWNSGMNSSDGRDQVGQEDAGGQRLAAPEPHPRQAERREHRDRHADRPPSAR